MIGSTSSRCGPYSTLSSMVVCTSILMKALAVAGLMVLPLLSLSCAGGDGQGAADLVALLPENGDISGFTATGEPVTYDRNSIWDYIGPNADLYLYNGFQTLARCQYQSSDGSQSLVAELFEFENPRQGFALYSAMRKPEFERLPIGAAGLYRADTLLVLKSNYLIKVYSPSGEEIPQLSRVAEVMAARIKTDEPLPKELDLFPRKGLIERSVRLTARDFLGQPELTDVFSASYLVDSDTVVLSFRLGSDNHVANVVREYIGSKGIITGLSIEASNQELSGEDTELGKLYSTVRGNALCFVTGFSDFNTAKQLAGQFYENLRGLETGE